jgi:hypothetical protein
MSKPKVMTICFVRKEILQNQKSTKPSLFKSLIFKAIHSKELNLWSEELIALRYFRRTFGKKNTSYT